MVFELRSNKPNLSKNRVACTHSSSNLPQRRNNNVLNIENISIFSITLKLGFCIGCSAWTELKVKGYCTPAFRVRSLSKALMKSLSAPPQHTMVGLADTALSNWAAIGTLPFTTGISQLQWVNAIITRFFPSQKHKLRLQRSAELLNSRENTLFYQQRLQYDSSAP